MSEEARFKTIEELNRRFKKQIAKCKTADEEAEVRIAWSAAQAEFHRRHEQLALDEKRHLEQQAKQAHDEWEEARRAYGYPVAGGDGPRPDRLPAIPQPIRITPPTVQVQVKEIDP